MSVDTIRKFQEIGRQLRNCAKVLALTLNYRRSEFNLRTSPRIQSQVHNGPKDGGVAGYLQKNRDFVFTEMIVVMTDFFCRRNSRYNEKNVTRVRAFHAQ